MANKFTAKRRLTEMAKNVLRKRYFSKGESKWKHVAKRVNDYVTSGDRWSEGDREDMYDILYHRYFLPNSPTLVNAGKSKNAGLSACYVVPFEDTIEDIYNTKLWFALIARKGGGCGTTLAHLRPEGATVAGSTHGYAGGGVKFADTISHDMDAITQSGLK